MAPKAPTSDLAPALARARRYAQNVKIACEDLYANPFDRQARAQLLRLIVDDSPDADAALIRALAAKQSLSGLHCE